MHRSRPTRSMAGRVALAAAVALAFVAAGAVGCGGDERTQPTLSSVNFTPKLIIEISGHDLTFHQGPRDDPAVSLADATVPAGTVVEVVNRGPGEHRLIGDTVFDTGIMRAGESTTIVVTNETTDAKRITITDPNDAELHGTLTVRPKPST